VHVVVAEGGVLFDREMFYVRALDCVFRRITVCSRWCLVPVYIVGYHSAIRRASTRDDNKRQFSVRGGGRAGRGGAIGEWPVRRRPGPPRSAPAGGLGVERLASTPRQFMCDGQNK